MDFLNVHDLDCDPSPFTIQPNPMALYVNCHLSPRVTISSELSLPPRFPPAFPPTSFPLFVGHLSLFDAHPSRLTPSPLALQIPPRGPRSQLRSTHAAVNKSKKLWSSLLVARAAFVLF